MPGSRLSPRTADALDLYQDLRSVPKHRQLGRNDIVERFRLAVPFDYIAISGLDVDHYRFGGGYSTDTDLPPAFIEAYYAARLHESDPFVAAAHSSQDVVLEHLVYETTPPPPRLLYLARTFGVHNRTLVPVKRVDLVYGAVIVARSAPFEEGEIAFLSAVADCIHTAVTRPLMERFAAQQIGLTRGEMACLSKASLGLTSEAIAEATGFQTETVNSYIKAAIKKLGASNRVEAIAQALRRRLIP
jgi:DNA-binding CsgD family transcriptional regulator